MKKIFYVIAMFAMMSIASCGNKATSTETPAADSVAVDTVVVADSAAVDTLVVDSVVVE